MIFTIEMREISVVFLYSLLSNTYHLFCVVSNFIYIRFVENALSQEKNNNENLKVSICIPARNEEDNISNCLEACQSQSYQNLEVLVLDDNSEDDTFLVAKEFAESSRQVSLHSGKKLPKDWLGKNWACYQLAQVASGDILLFIDADVQLSLDSTKKLVVLMQKRKIDAVSVIPKLIRLEGLGLRLVLPNLVWFLLSNLPIWLVPKLSFPSVSAGIGTYFAFRRNVYEDIGGHKFIKSIRTEDLALARRVKERGYKLMVLASGLFGTVNLYESFGKAIAGLSRSFFYAFKGGRILYWFSLVDMILAYLVPWILVWEVEYAWILVFMGLIAKFLALLSMRRDALLDMTLHPLQVLIAVYVYLNSWVKERNGQVVWRGREV
jgi:chlorobactene glucosyltransferase